jgi:hypothetical protein
MFKPAWRLPFIELRDPRRNPRLLLDAVATQFSVAALILRASLHQTSGDRHSAQGLLTYTLLKPRQLRRNSVHFTQ